MYGCRKHNARDNVDILRQIELFGRVLAGEKHDRILVDRMILQEVDHVVDLLPDDAPEIVDRFIARDRPMLLEFFFMRVK